MKIFNLEKALAGEKVIRRNGAEVNQLVVLNSYEGDVICGIINGVFYHYLQECDLFMAPTKLSGFVNTYSDLPPTQHLSKLDADCWSKNRTACIDLSQFEEGHGL